MNNKATQKELQALLQLIDDTDEVVIEHVEARLLQYGQAIIPDLEDCWEQNLSDEVQSRIEMIIHRIHFARLQEELINWKNGECDLLYGALLVAKYQYPDLQTMQALQEIERIRRNIWLEMNSYLTPIEQLKITESILYNYYKLKGSEVAYDRVDDFMLHKAIESKKGNTLITGILYLILAELLDLPMRALQIPKQFVLGWVEPSALFNNEYSTDELGGHIKLFVDPNSGIAFTHSDIYNYFRRIAVTPVAGYFKPMDNLDIVKLLLAELGKCFDTPALQYKRSDIQTLIELLD